MRSLLGLATLSALLIVPAAEAATIDFESTPTGSYNSLVFPDVTITYTGGTGFFDVTSANPGSAVSGHTLISFFQNPGPAPFRADFNVPVMSVQIAVGDFGADEDNSFMQAFSAANVLLDAGSFTNPAGNFGGGVINVSSATPIAYVLFWDGDPFPGGVYWDNLIYEGADTPVPAPGTLVLLAAGLVGVARRRWPFLR